MTSILHPEIPACIPLFVALGAGMTAAIFSRMNMRAFRACSSASAMISRVRPLILMSIWRAVMPLAVPATLKSMSP